MQKLVVRMDYDLRNLTPDELVALNQEFGKVIDEIKAYRRLIKEVQDEQANQLSNNSAWNDGAAYPEE